MHLFTVFLLSLILLIGGMSFAFTREDEALLITRLESPSDSIKAVAELAESAPKNLPSSVSDKLSLLARRPGALPMKSILEILSLLSNQGEPPSNEVLTTYAYFSFSGAELSRSVDRALEKGVYREDDSILPFLEERIRNAVSPYQGGNPDYVSIALHVQGRHRTEALKLIATAGLANPNWTVEVTSIRALQSLIETHEFPQEAVSYLYTIPLKSTGFTSLGKYIELVTKIPDPPPGIIIEHYSVHAFESYYQNSRAFYKTGLEDAFRYKGVRAQRQVIIALLQSPNLKQLTYWPEVVSEAERVTEGELAPEVATARLIYQAQNATLLEDRIQAIRTLAKISPIKSKNIEDQPTLDIKKGLLRAIPYGDPPVELELEARLALMSQSLSDLEIKSMKARIKELSTRKNAKKYGLSAQKLVGSIQQKIQEREQLLRPTRETNLESQAQSKVLLRASERPLIKSRVISERIHPESEPNAFLSRFSSTRAPLSDEQLWENFEQVQQNYFKFSTIAPSESAIEAMVVRLLDPRTHLPAWKRAIVYQFLSEFPDQLMNLRTILAFARADVEKVNTNPLLARDAALIVSIQDPEAGDSAKIQKLAESTTSGENLSLEELIMDGGHEVAMTRHKGRMKALDERGTFSTASCVSQRLKQVIDEANTRIQSEGNEPLYQHRR